MNSNCRSSEEVTSCGKLKVVPSVEPLFTRKLDVLDVIEGRNARFDCKVSGTPSPKVIWSHFGRIIHCMNMSLILYFAVSLSSAFYFINPL